MFSVSFFLLCVVHHSVLGLNSSFVLCNRVHPEAWKGRHRAPDTEGPVRLHVWTGCRSSFPAQLSVSCLSVCTSILRPNTNIVCIWKRRHCDKPLWDGCMVSHAAGDGRHKMQICLSDVAERQLPAWYWCALFRLCSHQSLPHTFHHHHLNGCLYHKFV